jgi:Polysaccharide lyase
VTTPTPAPPTTTTSPSPTPDPSWDGDFSTGNFSQYGGIPGNNPDGNPADFALAQTPTLSGFSNIFQATLESGSGSVLAGEDGERTLLTVWPGVPASSGKTDAYQGADTWYRDDIYFPSNFVASQGTNYNWLYVLHDWPDGPCCGNLSLSVVTDNSDGGPSGGARLSTRIMGGGDAANPMDEGTQNAATNPAGKVTWLEGPTVQTGRWYDLAWHVHWDWRANTAGGSGSAAYYINGSEIGSYSGPTLFYDANPEGSNTAGSDAPGPGQAYLQDGYYRPDDADAGYAQPTVTVDHAATMIGPTAASIGENLP